MGDILSGLINLGLGGVMAAALIWFLYHLVTKTLPDMHRAFREEVMAGRDFRLREHQALLQMIGQLAQEQHREHEAILAHLDAGLEGLVKLIAENRVAIEQRLELRQASGAGQEQGRRPRQQ